MQTGLIDQGPDTADTIVDLLYQGILRRKADPAGLAQYAAALRSGRSVTDLLRLFIACDEFRDAELVGKAVRKAPRRFVPLDAPAMDVEYHALPAQLLLLSKRIGDSWKELGNAVPFYSVLAQPEFHPKSLNDAALDQFWKTGERDAAIIQSVLARHGFGDTASKSCVEYGCGVGRVTFPLARMFEKVHAYDISPTHLQLAEQRAAQLGVDNVEFHLCARDIFTGSLQPNDFFFSMIVFQHNPPPLMHRLMQMCLESLRPGGIAQFQVPIYAPNYRFSVDEYLAGGRQPGMEMHFIPQRVVFRLVADVDCELLEVREDSAVGHIGEWISNTFIVKKRAS